MESAFIFICQIQKPGQEQKHSTSVSLKQHVVPAGVSTTYSKGLYNPLTLSGTIIVDGVVASVHSDWFLDTALNALGVPGWLPVAYQVQLLCALEECRHCRFSEELTACRQGIFTMGLCNADLTRVPALQSLFVSQYQYTSLYLIPHASIIHV